jgi:hypothetical protein
MDASRINIGDYICIHYIVKIQFVSAQPMLFSQKRFDVGDGPLGNDPCGIDLFR